MFCQFFRSVENQQDQVSFRQGLAGAFNPYFFNNIIRLADAGCVNELEGNPLDIDIFLDDITGGPGNICHDGLVFSQEVVEEAGFADIWTANNGGGEALAQDFPPTGCPEQLFQQGLKFLGLFPQEGSGHLFHIIILGIVDIDLYLGQGVEDFLAGIVNQVFQGTV